MNLPIVLDPRIGYHGLLAEAEMDENEASRAEYTEQIESAKISLKAYYLGYYLPQPTNDATAVTAPPLTSPATIDFFNAYTPPEDTSPTIEIDEFTKLRPLGFGKHTPLPLRWWKDHRDTYPNLSRLARDILAIPGEYMSFWLPIIILTSISSGSSVAVERIFSSGRDTISLRRASLKPETIRQLMLLKHRLLLAQRARERESYNMTLLS